MTDRRSFFKALAAVALAAAVECLPRFGAQTDAYLSNAELKTQMAETMRQLDQMYQRYMWGLQPNPGARVFSDRIAFEQAMRINHGMSRG